MVAELERDKEEPGDIRIKPEKVACSFGYSFGKSDFHGFGNLVRVESPSKRRRTECTPSPATSCPTTTRRRSTPGTPGARRRPRPPSSMTKGSRSTLAKPSQTANSALSSKGEQKAPGVTVPESPPTRDLLLPDHNLGTVNTCHLEHNQEERGMDHHHHLSRPPVTLQDELFRGEGDERLVVSSASLISSSRSSSATRKLCSSTSVSSSSTSSSSANYKGVSHIRGEFEEIRNLSSSSLSRTASLRATRTPSMSSMSGKPVFERKTMPVWPPSTPRRRSGSWTGSDTWPGPDTGLGATSPTLSSTSCPGSSGRGTMRASSSTRSPRKSRRLSGKLETLEEAMSRIRKSGSKEKEEEEELKDRSPGRSESKEEGKVHRREIKKSSSRSSSATPATSSSPAPSGRWVTAAREGGTERGPPGVQEKANNERSAYLLNPESEAGMGQKLLLIPSSLCHSSSSPGPHNLPGRGRLVSWGGGRKGGDFPPLQVTEIIHKTNNHYFPAMPSLPRSTARDKLARCEDDTPGSTMLAGQGRQGVGGESQLVAGQAKQSSLQ